MSSGRAPANAKSKSKRRKFNCHNRHTPHGVTNAPFHTQATGSSHGKWRMATNKLSPNHKPSSTVLFVAVCAIAL